MKRIMCMTAVALGLACASVPAKAAVVPAFIHPIYIAFMLITADVGANSCVRNCNPRRDGDGTWIGSFWRVAGVTQSAEIVPNPSDDLALVQWDPAVASELGPDG